MKCAVYSATDLVLNTSKERFYYPKGAMIQLEVGSDQDVYVVHHRLSEIEKEDGNKETAVVSTNLRVIRLEDLKFILDSIIFENQLSPSIDLLDVRLEDALLSERLTPAMIARYLTDATAALEKSYVKEKAQYLRIPIRSVLTVATVEEKIKALQNFNPMSADDIKSEDILSVDARAKGNANETGYLISIESLLGNTTADMLGYLETKMRMGLPEEWNVRKTPEGRIKVETKGARPAPLANFLSTLPVKTTLNYINKDGVLHYEVAIALPELNPVVETYYSREIVYKKFKTLEDNDTPAEGDDCTSEDGKKGTLKKQGDSLVCVVKESYIPDFREAVSEGDPCEDKDGKKGTMKKIGDNLVCVVKEAKVTQTKIEDTAPGVPSDAKEGDDCQSFGKKGKVVKNKNGDLYCQVTEMIEREAFTAPFVKLEAEFGGDGEGNNAASPAPGDTCDAQGRPGKLVLLNGALVCAVDGELPNGAEGAN